MESRHFVDKDGSFRVIVSSKLIDKIIHFCSISMVIEIGGILIGSYSKDSTTATLFEITAPRLIQRVEEIGSSEELPTQKSTFNNVGTLSRQRTISVSGIPIRRMYRNLPNKISTR